MNRREILAAMAALSARYVIPPSVQAQGKNLVHGIVVDEDGNAVLGGEITAWLKIALGWTRGPSKVLQSQSWQLYLGAGTYKITYLQEGWTQVAVSPREFTLPGGVPVGDVLTIVCRVTPVPTETVWATETLVVETPTPTPTEKPCLSFQQFSRVERRDVIANACMRIGKPLETDLGFDNDLTLLFGLRDLMLGAPLTPKFSVGNLTCRGFAQAIIVIRTGELAREECWPFGVVGWGGNQNWQDE